jgi:hypothetical protein
MVRLSVYREAEKEIEVHRWVESEQAGRDLGVDAEVGWSKSYWLRFYRRRFVRHLRGEAMFEEFDLHSFGIVNGRLTADRVLLDSVLDHIGNGDENLTIILWAQSQSLPMEQVIEILEAVNINSQKLAPPR